MSEKLAREGDEIESGFLMGEDFFMWMKALSSDLDEDSFLWMKTFIWLKTLKSRWRPFHLAEDPLIWMKTL